MADAEKKAIPVMTRIWPELHPVLQRLAEHNRRSMNFIINQLVEEALIARGELSRKQRGRHS